MSPAINSGEVLIVDIMVDSIYQHNQSRYVLVADGEMDSSHKATSITDVLKYSDVRFYVRKVIKSAGEFYFEAENPRFAPIPYIGPDNDGGRFTLLVGTVIQKIVTYVYDINCK